MAIGDLSRTDQRTTPGSPGHVAAPRRGAEPLGTSFWRLWSASAASNLADGIAKLALPLIAVSFTDSPVLVAGVAMAFSLPWLLVALLAGALADRLDRRRVMVAANTVRAVLFGAMALATALDAASIWLLYAVAFGAGVAETLYDTSAQSILPQVVSRDALSRANGRLNAVELTANQFVGPPLAGFLVSAGVALAVAGPAGLWVVAAAVLLLLRGRFRVARDTPTSLRTDIGEGLRFLWRHQLLRTLAVMVGISNFTMSAVLAVLVLYAVGPDSAMGLTEPGYGLLLATLAVGIVLGSLVAGAIERRLGRSAALGVAMVAAAVLVGVPALSTNPFVVGAVYFGGGILVATWNVITISLRQRITPDRLLGRVNSGYRLLAWGGMPLGALTGGLLAEWLGLRAVFAVMGVLAFSMVIGLFWVTDSAIDAAERDAEQQV
ncbi:MFS transporter [Salinispora tropica]|uniref:Major facilitator superfamily MFS_1 n=1 Tax=Salinispora tropica (strain ATCC BAA-916 / DSM 44818 / JCM 13857 / NBRC 105044 / CNB-440) TaxID=369723 RepID=A4X2N3_SALTO|nr:MFS transporter [Salinispora tropica]ABP53133.1 major facilitator superfamily MFS_1 [Salinispora tropica CNB-440]